MKLSVSIPGLFAMLTSIATGAVIYNESVSGDLSNDGLAPTLVALGPGSNQILGSTGRDAFGVDRDYFTFTLSPGQTLQSMVLLPGTQVGGTFSFVGLQAGNQVTLPPNAGDATGLLGWWHYSSLDVGSDLLPLMAVPSAGSSGFTIPLGPGSYAFWIQDFNPGPLNYGFELQIAQSPEPSTAGLILLPLGTLAWWRRRRAS